MSAPLDRQFRDSAALLVQMLDPAQDRLLVAQMSEEDYRTASFLDQRVLAGGRPCDWIDWPRLESWSAGLSDDCGFIFHIGHVGSTLISRLLGELPSILSVREPLILRTFAELERLRSRPHAPWAPEEQDRRLGVTLAWLSRSFRPGQQAVVKATSFVGEIAHRLQRPGRRSIALSVSADTYLATILAGDASRQELALLSGDRLARLHARLGEEPWKLWELSLGERAALAWSCETTALAAAADGDGAGDLLWVDFDRFLAAPAASLTALAAHLGHPLDPAAAEALAAGPLMRRYSKAMEHDYSPALRQAVLAQARRDHGPELKRGRAFIDAAAARYPAVARALQRAG